MQPERISTVFSGPESSSSNARMHVVQFYKDEAFFLDTLAQFIGGALAGGDAAIAIATPDHRKGLAHRLVQRSLDPLKLQADGRLMLLDAETTLAQFLVDGWPDNTRFVKTCGGAIEKVSAACNKPNPRVAAFGEMVSLLWARGQRSAAIRLEELWNELAKSRLFSLRCGYPLESLTNDASAQDLLKVCAQHSHVIPPETFNTAGDDNWVRDIVENKRSTESQNRAAS